MNDVKTGKFRLDDGYYGNIASCPMVALHEMF